MQPDSQKNIAIENLLPEPGQLVEVRRRQWVVTQIDSNGLARNLRELQHLVTLESIDEDALDEELQVIWEIEPGAKILEKAGLPVIGGYDPNYKLEAFLDAVQWGAASNADRQSLQAPFRSGITIEDYQLDPLVRAISMARVNLLIADDVGLGKTIEAGLVIQEMMIRHRARTVLVVCPASLQVKWQTEMQDKFGLEFRIVDTEYIRILRRERGRQANPWTSYPRLITSMDWIKGGEGLRLLKDILPPQISYPRMFDILVIDEAHNVAPAAAAAYSIPSQRTQVIQRLSPHFSHHLFLTATPHNGYKESFTSLLELLDNQRFAKTVEPDEQQLQQVMVRRLKSNIVDAAGKPVFPTRELLPLEVDYTEDERKVHDLLRQFCESRMKSVGDSRYAYGTKFVHILLKKRLFSSPAAFAKTLAKHRETLEHGKHKEKSNNFDDRILHRAIMKAEEEFSNEALADEAAAEVLELNAAAYALSTRHTQFKDVFEYLTALKGGISKVSPISQNVGGILLAYWKKGEEQQSYEFSDLFFSASALKFCNLNNITFNDCSIEEIDAVNGSINNVCFNHCTISSMMIPSYSVQNINCTFDLQSIPSHVYEKEHDEDAYSPAQIMTILSRCGSKFSNMRVEEIPTSKPQDEILTVFCKIVKYLCHYPGISGSVLSMKFGSRWNTYRKEYLPIYLRRGLLESTSWQGHGVDERYKLGIRLDKYESALKECNGSFDEFTTLCK